MSIFSLSKKNAVVTGGGSGIGRAIAKLFAEQGACICVVDLDPEAAKETVDELKAQSYSAVYYNCDIANPGLVDQTFVQIRKELENIDILVNSAGVAHIGNIENTSAEDLDQVYRVNVKGAFNCMKAAIPLMKGRSGTILNIASIASSVGIADRLAYSMSKGAVLAMTMAVAKDYLHQRIRCNCISPARVHTAFVDGFLKKNYPGKEDEMFQKLAASQPIGRMAKPEEIASLALYLCSDEASFVTGNDYAIDGGYIKLNS